MTPAPGQIQRASRGADKQGVSAGTRLSRIQLVARGALVSRCFVALTLACALVAATASSGTPSPIASTAGSIPKGISGFRAPESVRGDRILEAWGAPADSLAEQVAVTRGAALETGVWSFDAAARALLRSPELGTPLDRARGAVALAPDLPSAHIALAEQMWWSGAAPTAVLHSALAALAAAARHPEAAFWFGGSLLFLAAVGLVAGGALTLLAAAAAAFLRAAHDLGHLLAPGAPEFARAALLAALLLLPPAFGLGALGLLLACLALGLAYGSLRQRGVLALAVAAIGLGAFPVADLASRSLAFFSSDAVARAAVSVASGADAPRDRLRLSAAAESDPMALRGLAMLARRHGRLGEADALYQRLVKAWPRDAALANNAANVRLELGHFDSAYALYDRALIQGDSAIVLFNLSQAHGRAFRVDALNATLARAQEVDGERMAEFTALAGRAGREFVVDLPVSVPVLWRRMLGRRDAGGVASELRGRLAPGVLGDSPLLFAGLAVVLLVSFSWIGSRFEIAHGCGRCGTRLCPRCDPNHADCELCPDCARLFYRPEQTDRALRAERMGALRLRERRLRGVTALAAVLLPAAAGALTRRPATMLLGALGFSLAVACVIWPRGPLPDPLVAGAAAPLAILSLGVLAAVLHLGTAARALSHSREERE